MREQHPQGDGDGRLAQLWLVVFVKSLDDFELVQCQLGAVLAITSGSSIDKTPRSSS
jgi:hypothetical protein